MRCYLSSYQLGNYGHKLKELFNDQVKIGCIFNALDFPNAQLNIKKREETINNNLGMLSDIGLSPELLDLKEYFGQTDKLREKLNTLNGVFVSGGNTFILRQAFKLSGFDLLFEEFKYNNDWVYSGYSAGCCVLSPTLECYCIVDKPDLMPYENSSLIMEGLGFLDYVFMPHFESNHPESEDINKEVELCKKKNILFKTFQDGESQNQLQIQNLNMNYHKKTGKKKRKNQKRLKQKQSIKIKKIKKTLTKLNPELENKYSKEKNFKDMKNSKNTIKDIEEKSAPKSRALFKQLLEETTTLIAEKTGRSSSNTQQKKQKKKSQTNVFKL